MRVRGFQASLFTLPLHIKEIGLDLGFLLFHGSTPFDRKVYMYGSVVYAVHAYPSKLINAVLVKVIP